MPFPVFKIFSGQFRASGNSSAGPSKAEKLIGSGKKISRLPQGNGFYSRYKKNVISIYSATGNVSQGLWLSTFKKNLHYGNQGLINNLSAKSI